MTKTELREIIANGRNSGIEFKRDLADGHELAKDVVAFANGWGGRILLGVDDDGSVHGLGKSDPPSRLGAPDTGQHSYRWLDQLVMQTCRDKIQPAIVPYVDVYRDVVADRAVVVVETTRGWNMHHVLHHQHRTCYIRTGSSSREAGPDEVKRQFPIRGRFRPELRPVSGTSIADLDRRRLMDYFNRVRDQYAPASWPSAEWRQSTGAWARREDEKRWRTLVEHTEQEWHETREAEWESLLVNTEILDDGNRRAATVAGLMLFGKNPGRFLPQAKIDAVACFGSDAVACFGSEKDYAARERATLRGPIVCLKGVDGTELEPGLIEQAVQFVRRNIEPVTLEDGVRRQERWDYPEEVIREALVNAIVHRDYLLSGSNIELGIYSNRLEIVSPGRLTDGITPERMRVGCRSARNELLKDVMRDYGYVEHMGMGVPRKIIRGMREHNGTEPDLIEENERFTVRLWKDAAG